MRLVLVRHAHAGDRDAWSGDDAQRPLTPRGDAQARGLVALVRPLLDPGPVDLATSPAVRCAATLAPLARDLGVEVTVADHLAEGAHAAGLVDRIARLTRTAVWCSHGDVIPGLLMALAARGLDLGPDPRCRKASAWVLDVADGGVTAARYLPPPEA